MNLKNNYVSDNMRFTNLTKKDIPLMIQLAKESGGDIPSKSWLEKILERGSRAVAVKEEDYVGYYVYDETFKGDKEGVELDLIIVNKKYQRREYGTKMIQKLEKDTKKIKKRKVYLFVRPKNKNAIAFYSKLRYYVTGALYDRYGKGKHALILTKDVSADGKN